MAIIAFPPVDEADENGLLALGGDMEVSSLLLAYSRGIFPWPISDEYPLAWFSPDPRGVLEYKNLHIPRKLNSALNKNKYTVTFNQQFDLVIQACAEAKRKDQPGTWINQEIIDCFTQLFEQGHSYSVEVINKDEEVIGGLYGVCLGNYLSGESMFFKETNASKIGLVTLMQHLHQKGVDFLDTQMVTPVVASLGGTEIPRSDFIKRVENRGSRERQEIFST